MTTPGPAPSRRAQTAAWIFLGLVALGLGSGVVQTFSRREPLPRVALIVLVVLYAVGVLAWHPWTEAAPAPGTPESARTRRRRALALLWFGALLGAGSVIASPSSHQTPLGFPVAVSVMTSAALSLLFPRR